MAVNQLSFLLLFFISVVFYYIIPRKCQWMMLLGISLVFYHFMGVNNFSYIIFTALTVTFGTQQMHKIDKKLKKTIKELTEAKIPVNKKELKAKAKSQKKVWLVILIVANLGILVVLKYGNFFIENLNYIFKLFGSDGLNKLGWIAPLGMSYYTLQIIGYTLDVYKGKKLPEKNPLKVLLFITYYPQMTQGPIGRYPDLSEQLYAEHSFSYHNLSYGCQRIMWGFMKKLVVADHLRIAVRYAFDNYESVSGFTLCLGCCYMVIQMYADFSGYSDIVCGVSQVYGIHLMENFKRPLFSQSLGEYWRRWHISLSSWFRDYIFYPVSISKGAMNFGKFWGRFFSPRIKKIFPVVYAMSIVWVCTGLWHDASWRYILWGAANGVILISSVILEDKFKSTKEKLHINDKSWWWQGFCMFRTFLIVAFLKIFPGADTTRGSLIILKRMIFNFDFDLSFTALFGPLEYYQLVYIFVGLLLMLLVSIMQTRGPVRDWLASKPVVFRWLVYLLILNIIIFMGFFDTSVPGGFEYAQF